MSRRTIFRDLETLREAGVPLQFDAESDRYTIPSTFFLPPTNLTPSEALSIIALASQLGTDSRLPFYGPARQAALKIESSLPEALREEIQAATRSIHIHSAPVNPLTDKAEFYQQILESISTRRVLRMKYGSLTEWETISTKLRPYQLLFNGRTWFVIGRSSIHREVRTFNLSRIESLKQLREKYAVPKSFNLDKYLGNAWNMIPGPGADHKVVVRFQPLVARNVAEVAWHNLQRTKFLEDGSLEFRVTVSGLDEIAWWILGYGDQAEVLKPVKLRRLIARRIRQMHAVYNSEDA